MRGAIPGGRGRIAPRADGREDWEMGLRLRACLLLSAAAAALPVAARAQAPQLLFHVSADKSLAADQAGGDKVPNFQDRVKIVPTGVGGGGAIQWEDDGVVTWNAPG